MLAEVLQRQHPKYIVRYHEHDLLLENVEAEELTEEERKQAWKSYEDEKENAKVLCKLTQLSCSVDISKGNVLLCPVLFVIHGTSG